MHKVTLSKNKWYKDQIIDVLWERTIWYTDDEIRRYIPSLQNTGYDVNIESWEGYKGLKKND